MPGHALRAQSIAAVVSLVAACSSAPTRPTASPAAVEREDPRPSPTALQTATDALEPHPAPGPVGGGELPWWHDLEPGVYRYRGLLTAMAVGHSADHHHVSEGFFKSKVTARLGVRKAAEPVAFSGTMPEPQLSDLFITRDQKFYALYELTVPDGAKLQAPAAVVEIPPVLHVAGRRRVGRHVFEGARHLYLECDVEGPIANPDWGRTRATALLTP